MAGELTQEALKAMLKYDEFTGEFTWLVPRPRVSVGQIAGCLNNDGYVLISVAGRRMYAHRLAFLYMTGSLPRDRVDHINQLPSDNRWSNLREATMSQNLCNVSDWAHNTSGYKGVYPSRSGRTHHVKIQHDSVQYSLGTYSCPKEAAHAYNKAAIELHGEFAVLNPI